MILFLLSIGTISTFLRLYAVDDSLINPFNPENDTCPDNWTDPNVQPFKKGTDCPSEELIIDRKHQKEIKILAIVHFFLAILLFSTLECINSFSRLIREKLSYIANICIDKKNFEILKKLINLHPTFESGYRVQYLTIISGAIGYLTKVFSNCDVNITPVDIFALITGTSAFYLLLQSLGYFLDVCCSSFKYISNEINFKTDKEFLFRILSKVFDLNKRDHSKFRCRDIFLTFLIVLSNLIIPALFSPSAYYYYNDVYNHNTTDDQEKYCRCQYYRNDPKGNHFKVFICSMVSLGISALAICLIASRKNLQITQRCKKQFNRFKNTESFETVKVSNINPNDAGTKYKEFFASAIQVGLITSLSTDKIYNWCTNNAAIEFFFFGIAAFFSGINCLYYASKLLTYVPKCCGRKELFYNDYELIEDLN